MRQVSTQMNSLPLFVMTAIYFHVHVQDNSQRFSHSQVLSKHIITNQHRNSRLLTCDANVVMKDINLCGS